MICKKCNEDMNLINKYKSNDYYESNEYEYKCPRCGSKVFIFEGCEDWEIEKDEEDEEYENYYNKVGVDISDLVEVRR